MNIKSLLIGSAAALVAVSGARAADAVMAEPEPVEYVKVCDAYGAGFFYIPGTETCVQFSGLVWLQIGASSRDDNDFLGSYEFGTGDRQDGFITSSNIRFNVDARSETEWGTLRSFIRFQSDQGSNYNTRDSQALVDQAYLQIGGFTMGYTESLFEGAIGPYGLSYGGYGSSSWNGLYYGYNQRDLVAYTYKSGNGFFAGVSLEDDGYQSGDAFGGDDDNNGYVPDVVGMLAYEQAWGGIFGAIAYDESADAFTAKITAQYNFGTSWIRGVASYANAANDYNLGGPVGQARYSLLAEFGHKFTDKLTVSVAGQYFGDSYGNNFGFGFVAPNIGSDHRLKNSDAYAIELNVVYTPVTNFEIRTEIVYSDANNDTNHIFRGDDHGDGNVSGFLRFTRYF